jgi:DNA repair exonuclease SbcCD ATPase subunit
MKTLSGDVEAYTQVLDSLYRRVSEINVRVDELERLQGEHDALINAIELLEKLRSEVKNALGVDHADVPVVAGTNAAGDAS